MKALANQPLEWLAPILLLHTTRYGWLRQSPRSGELKR